MNIEIGQYYSVVFRYDPNYKPSRDIKVIGFRKFMNLRREVKTLVILYYCNQYFKFKKEMLLEGFIKGIEEGNYERVN